MNDTTHTHVQPIHIAAEVGADGKLVRRETSALHKQMFERVKAAMPGADQKALHDMAHRAVEIYLTAPSIAAPPAPPVINRG